MFGCFQTPVAHARNRRNTVGKPSAIAQHRRNIVRKAVGYVPTALFCLLFSSVGKHITRGRFSDGFGRYPTVSRWFSDGFVRESRVISEIVHCDHTPTCIVKERAMLKVHAFVMYACVCVHMPVYWSIP